jgi:hypothetical protein
MNDRYVEHRLPLSRQTVFIWACYRPTRDRDDLVIVRKRPWPYMASDNNYKLFENDLNWPENTTLYMLQSRFGAADP